MKTQALLGGGIVLLLLGGCARKQAEPPAEPPPPPIHVETLTVEPHPMPRALPLTGSLMSNQQSDVAANASGVVVKTFVERGAFVKAGAPLVQLDTRNAQLTGEEARANLANAQAQLELAKAQCERSQQLFDKGAISKEEFDRTSSQCKTTLGTAEAAKARAELAENTLKDSLVRAPFSGMVAERYVSVGEYVQPPSKVANVVELDPLRLQLTVGEADIGLLREGQEVRFDVAAFPGELFTGTVKYIGAAVRTSTRDLIVEAVVPNPEHKLRPGMFATAHLQLPDQPLPAVPKTALVSDGSATHLFTVVDGHIEERIIQTGPERDGLVAVIDGLKAGEHVVSQPGSQVKDGTPVN